MAEVWVVQCQSENQDPIVMCVCDERDLAIEHAVDYVKRDNGCESEGDGVEVTIYQETVGDCTVVYDGSFESNYAVFMERVISRFDQYDED